MFTTASLMCLQLDVCHWCVYNCYKCTTFSLVCLQHCLLIQQLELTFLLQCDFDQACENDVKLKRRTATGKRRLMLQIKEVGIRVLWLCSTLLISHCIVEVFCAQLHAALSVD